MGDPTDGDHPGGKVLKKATTGLPTGLDAVMDGGGGGGGLLGGLTLGAIGARDGKEKLE
jgi:hypothetical protein